MSMWDIVSLLVPRPVRFRVAHRFSRCSRKCIHSREWQDRTITRDRLSRRKKHCRRGIHISDPTYIAGIWSGLVFIARATLSLWLITKPPTLEDVSMDVALHRTELIICSAFSLLP